jgi:hypothetical protein
MNSWKGLHEALAVASVTSSFSTAGPSIAGGEVIADILLVRASGKSRQAVLQSLIGAIRNMNWTEFICAFTVCGHWNLLIPSRDD